MSMSPVIMPKIHAVPCFLDNYVWLIECRQGCWAVDPGDAAPVMAALQALNKPLLGILVTHHHADHIGGVPELLTHYPVSVLGPAETASVASVILHGNEALALDGLGRVDVLAVGAHTLGHIAYYLADHGHLFCGDTLFSAGCGRLFEGTPADLERAMQRLNALPAETVIFPTHEYTLSNLRFAQAVEPDNAAIAAHLKHVMQWRAENIPSLPTHLALERQINPFLRTHDAVVVASTSRHVGRETLPGLDTLTALRAWKDVFRA